jgi:acyl-CoA synthetase (AMP-forming)/AMP-acid ligase II
MAAGYGLAEATVGVAMTKPGTGVRSDARGTVSVGLPFPGVEIEIRRDGRHCAAGDTGDVHVRSIANARGYFRDADATAALFDADGYLATGDVGYVDERGELYVVGRAKNTIIVAGRTVAPREIEEAAEGADRRVRFAAAIGVGRDSRAGEQIVVLAEMRAEESAEALAETARHVSTAVRDKIAILPLDVLLLQPHAIPLTHNGKLQHASLRASYEDGSLSRSGTVLYPPG